MNKIILLGNLTKDVNVRYTQNGKPVARTSIAVNRKVKNPQGKYDSDFFNLIAWDKTAEFFGNYLQKGSRILVEGRLQNNHYTDKNNVKHYSEDVVVENVEFAGGKSANKSDDGFKGEEVPEEDVPF